LSIVQTDDSQAFVAATRRYYRGLTAATQPATDPAESQPTTQASMPSFIGDYQENVLQLEGTPVDRFSLRIQPPAGMGGARMDNLPGQDGYLAVADSFVVSTLTPDIELLGQGLKAVKQGGGLGSDPLIQQVRQDGLPQDPTFQAYVNTRVVANTVNGVLAMMMAPPLAVPQDLPPLGIAVALRDGGIVKRLYVPMPVLQFGGHAFQQVMAAQHPAGEPAATQPQTEESGEEPQPQPGDEQAPDEGPAQAPSAPF
jgi:hypothetical protein